MSFQGRIMNFKTESNKLLDLLCTPGHEPRGS